MKSARERWSSLSRTLLHVIIGAAAILLLVIASKDTVIGIGTNACVVFIAIEVVRPNLYWSFSQEVVGKKQFRFRAMFGWFFQHLIDKAHWVLCKIKLLRPDKYELEYPATSANFASSILLSLLCAPLWAVGPAVAMFAWSDAAAREGGLYFCTGPLPWGSDPDPKTWGGIWSYTIVSVIIGAITVILQEYYGVPFYPPAVFPYVPTAIGVTAVVGGLLESGITKEPTLTSRIFDDNTLVPYATSMTFFLVASAGAML